MKLPSIGEISEKAKGAFKRFPITLIWAILGSGYCIYAIGDDAGDFFDHRLGAVLTLILGVSWLICTQFYIEQRKSPEKWLWLKLLVLGLLALFYWHLPDFEKYDTDPSYIFRFFLYLIAGHLFVFFAPFIHKWDKAAYWNYLKSIGYALLRSAFFSGVLYLGLVFALAAVDALFEVNIRGERYAQLFIFCLGIVNTWMYLSDFPKNILDAKDISFNKAIEVFVKYILIPLVLLYTIILYAYGFKILFQWELPQGWVSYLVTALALLGFVVQVIINPVQKTVKSWTINTFYPWYYVVLLPLIALLFVAIFRRILDYGITENRYFVLVIAFWILGISLYLLVAKKKKLIVLPISLFILAILSSFGFWGAFNVAKNSQLRQFKKVFQEIKANHNLASYSEYDQLKSILNYLDERRSLSLLDETTHISMEIAFKDTIDGKFQSYGYLDTQKILDSLEIALDPKADDPNQGQNGKFYNYYNDHYGVHNYDIAGFSHFAPISFNSYSPPKLKIESLDIVFDPDEVVLSFLSKKDSSVTLDIPLKKKLLELTKYGSDLSKLEEDEITFISKNDRILVKLILTDLGFNVKNDSISVNHANAYLFLKRP